MPPMTILLGADTFYPDLNGAARFTERLAAGLVGRGHDVHVVAPATASGKSGTFTEVIEGRPLTVHRWPSMRWAPHEWVRFTWPQVAQVLAPRTIREVRPDVVHVQSHIIGGRYLIKTAHRLGIRLVATNHVMPENILDHTTLPDSLNRLFARWAWGDADRLLRRAEVVTTPTRRAADFLETNTSIRGVIPISCGVDLARYRPRLDAEAPRRVLFVGRLTREKQVDVLIRAVAATDPDLDVRLDIVGDGDQRHALHAVASEAGIADRVEFHGAVSDEDLVELYSRAGLFAIASIAELQSIATLEALSSALPIVAADAMALPHLVRDGENGYLFPPGDVKAAADRIERVVRLDPEARLAMQRASLAVVRPHSLEHTLDVFEAIYRGEPIPE